QGRRSVPEPVLRLAHLLARPPGQDPAPTPAPPADASHQTDKLDRPDKMDTSSKQLVPLAPSPTAPHPLLAHYRRLRLTRAQVSEIVGIDERTLAMVEAGLTPLADLAEDDQAKLALLFGVTRDELTREA